MLGCASASRAAPSPVALDLPPPVASVDGATVAVVGDQRATVDRLVDDLRAALAGRDVAALRALFAPTLGAMQQPAPGVSREEWLRRGDAIFTEAHQRPLARVRVLAYADCAPRCPALMLAPGEWLVRLGDNAPSDRALPTALRVAVVEGVARVVGVDDEIALVRGPAAAGRVSGSRPP